MVKWSPGLEVIHGFSPGTFPGTFEAFRNEIHPADRDGVLEAIGAAVDQRRDHHIEYRIVRADGRVRWVEGRGKLFCDQAGHPERMVGVCSDITKRKHADEKFRLAVEAAPAAQLMVDQRGTIVLVNALTEQLLGYARDEIVGQPLDRLVPPRFRDRHPEYRRNFFADLHQRPTGAGRDQAELWADACAEAGLDAMTVATGVQGYRRACDSQPAIILLDLMLPDIDGREVCRRLKTDGRTKHIPIVVLTVCDEPQGALRATEAGCAAYLKKPCAPRELVSVNKKVLREQNAV